MDSLFAQTITKPLADRMRPRRLSDFAGQEKALGPGSPLRRMIERDALQPLLLRLMQYRAACRSCAG